MPVRILTGGTRIDGVTINVSEGGMYVFAAANLSPGGEVEIVFRPPGRKKAVRACGVVRRRALYLYGIEFLNNDSAATGDRTFVQSDESNSRLYIQDFLGISDIG